MNRKRMKDNLLKSKKTKREWLEDIIVALVVITVVGGMLIYAHYDIMRIVNKLYLKQH